MKTALITGASAGIGLELAKLFAQDGHSIFIVVAKLQKNKLFNYVNPAATDDVAKAGYAAMNCGESICVPGMRNKLLVQSLRITPRTLVRNLTANLNRM